LYVFYRPRTTNVTRKNRRHNLLQMTRKQNKTKNT